MNNQKFDEKMQNNLFNKSPEIKKSFIEFNENDDRSL